MLYADFYNTDFYFLATTFSSLQSEILVECFPWELKRCLFKKMLNFSFFSYICISLLNYRHFIGMNKMLCYLLCYILFLIRFLTFLIIIIILRFKYIFLIFPYLYFPYFSLFNFSRFIFIISPFCEIAGYITYVSYHL